MPTPQQIVIKVSRRKIHLKPLLQLQCKRACSSIFFECHSAPPLAIHVLANNLEVFFLQLLAEFGLLGPGELFVQELRERPRCEKSYLPAFYIGHVSPNMPKSFLWDSGDGKITFSTNHVSTEEHNKISITSRYACHHQSRHPVDLFWNRVKTTTTQGYTCDVAVESAYLRFWRSSEAQWWLRCFWSPCSHPTWRGMSIAENNNPRVIEGLHRNDQITYRQPCKNHSSRKESIRAGTIWSPCSSMLSAASALVSTRA